MEEDLSLSFAFFPQTVYISCKIIMSKDNKNANKFNSPKMFRRFTKIAAHFQST